MAASIFMGQPLKFTKSRILSKCPIPSNKSAHFHTGYVQTNSFSRISGASGMHHKRMLFSSTEGDPPAKIAMEVDEASGPQEDMDPHSEDVNTRAQSGNGASPSNLDGGSGSSTLELWSKAVPANIQHYWKHNTSAKVVKDCGKLLQRNLWSVLSLSLLNSAARFALCWGLYKTVAAVAVVFFGVPPSSIPQEMLPPVGKEGDTVVYTQLADITFLLFKPLDYLVKGIFVATVLMMCSNSSVSPEDGHEEGKKLEAEGPKPGIIKRVWRGLGTAVAFLWQAIKCAPDLIVVHAIAGALTVGYQGMCLLIVPFLFAIRRLLNIQLALYTAAIEGQKGRQALKRSTSLVEPLRPILYMPYVLLFASPKLLGSIQDALFRVIPSRLFTEVPELTWGLVGGVSVLSFLLDRMHDILPVVVYGLSKATSEPER